MESQSAVYSISTPLMKKSAGNIHSYPYSISDKESGTVDSFFILIPILFIATSLFSLFQYGVSQNELSSSATLVGRQIARQSNSDNLNEYAERIISQENLRVSDFHLMRYPIGNQIFIQLVLVGKPVRIGWTVLTPSARSLTLVDQWR